MAYQYLVDDTARCDQRSIKSVTSIAQRTALRKSGLSRSNTLLFPIVYLVPTRKFEMWLVTGVLISRMA